MNKNDIKAVIFDFGRVITQPKPPSLFRQYERELGLEAGDFIPITIRRVRSSDASALQRHCFPDQTRWEVQGYLIWCERQAAKGQVVRLVAEVSGEAVANAQLTLRRDWAEIGGLVVAERWRRQGIATRLIEALTEIARRQEVQTLEIGVAQSALGVQRFYRSLGFVPYKEVDLDFIREGNRVVYLRKELGRDTTSMNAIHPMTNVPVYPAAKEEDEL